MSGHLQGLYPPMVLEHGRRPRNRRIPAGATHRASGDNPLCGDQIVVHLCVADGCIRDIGFDGVCCIYATASASLMTQAVMGQDLEFARELHGTFLQLMAGADPANLPHLGELASLSAIGLARERLQCASLAWQALESALRAASAAASAEHALLCGQNPAATRVAAAVPPVPLT